MLNAYNDPIAFDYKLCFDGHDFINSQLGKETANPFLVDWVESHHNQHDLSFAENFVIDCIAYRRKHEPDHLLPLSLRDKYEIGLFCTSKQNCFDHPYAMFNEEALDLWQTDHVNVWGQYFLVAPSRGVDGRINELGFRVLDTESVRNAFKWTFMCGQQATYGLHRVEGQDITVVEGAWDYIAFQESSVSNVVGLGAVRLSEGHKRILQGYSITECWDADSFGIAQRKDKYCFFSPEGKDPFDAWVTNGKLSLITVGS